MKRALNSDSSPFEQGLRKSARLQEKENKVESSNSVPALPDDLLFMIFIELSTEERAPLGTTCKRFRELDFELGCKSFDEICVGLSHYCTCVILKAPKIQYAIGQIGADLIQLTRRPERLLRRSNTAKIKIWIHQSPNGKVAMSKHPEIEQLLSLIKTIPCKKFGVHIGSNQDGSFNFSFLPQLRDGIWESATFRLSLKGDCATHDVGRTREMLLQLPKMDKFNLQWFSKTQKPGQVDGPILDDATLLHIASCTNHAQLAMTEPTTQGVLDVFEVVCRSPIPTKYVCFDALRPVADGFFATQNIFPMRTLKGGQRSIYDPRRRSMLQVIATDHYDVFVMGKYHGAGMPMYETVEW